MKKLHRTSGFARMALLFSLSLTAACATTTPVEKAGPQAPGVGFEVVIPAPASEAPPAAVTTPAPPPSPTLDPAPAASPAPIASRIKHQHKYVNVRPDPSSGNKPVAVLQGGKRIEVVGEQESWVKIRWTRGKKELEGWVFKKYVEGQE